MEVSRQPQRQQGRLEVSRLPQRQQGRLRGTACAVPMTAPFQTRTPTIMRAFVCLIGCGTRATPWTRTKAGQYRRQAIWAIIEKRLCRSCAAGSMTAHFYSADLPLDDGVLFFCWPAAGWRRQRAIPRRSPIADTVCMRLLFLSRPLDAASSVFSLFGTTELCPSTRSLMPWCGPGARRCRRPSGPTSRRWLLPSRAATAA